MTAPSFCAYHHTTPATASCSACEKPVCGVCTSTVNARSLCSSCSVGGVTQKPWLALLFSLLLPGAGQVYNGEWRKGLVIFALGPLVVPWIWGVVDAANVAAEIAAGRQEGQTVPTGAVLVGVKILWLPLAALYSFFAFAVLTLLVGLLS